MHGNLHNVSNDDTAVTAFSESPLMSTYLVAFIVSDMKNMTNAPNRFPHRIFVPQPDLDAAEYGLKHSEIVLNTLQQYLQVNFSMPKMDQAVVPDMYSWGI